MSRDRPLRDRRRGRASASPLNDDCAGRTPPVSGGTLINVRVGRKAAPIVRFENRWLQDQRMTFSIAASAASLRNNATRKLAVQAVVADPLAFGRSLYRGPRGRSSGSGRTTPSDPSRAVTRLVKLRSRGKLRTKSPLEFLDTDAEIGHAVQERGRSVRSHARLDPRLLTKNGGKRYAASPREGARGANDSTEASVWTIEDRDLPAEPYVPGTISLPRNAAKYPAVSRIDVRAADSDLEAEGRSI